MRLATINSTPHTTSLTPHTTHTPLPHTDCPCILFGQNMDKMGKGFCGNCCMFACAANCNVCCFVTSGPRGEIRYRYGIISGNDFCITMCCAQCALIQEAKQLSNV